MEAPRADTSGETMEPELEPEFSFHQETKRAPLEVIDLSQPGVAPPRKAAPIRRKQAPERGFSQLDWIRLGNSGADLSGDINNYDLHQESIAMILKSIDTYAGLNGSPRRKVKIADVKQHSQPDDCWTVLHGRVYNIAPYLRFHPGEKYHAWVNFDMLLEKCLIGVLDPN